MIPTIAIDWKQLAAQVRGHLDRAVLKERQRRVTEIVVKATLVRGRLCVRVPRLAEFEHLIGVTKGNLSVIFGELKRARILQVRALAEGGMEIVILPDARNWDVVWRYERSELQRFLRGLDAYTGQVQEELLPPEPSLVAALAEVSAESSVPDLGTIPFPIWERVPDLGTNPVPDSGTDPVPNLGTGSSKGPSNKAPVDLVPNLGTNPVPVSGTTAMPLGGRGGFTVQRFTASEEEDPDPKRLNGERLNGTRANNAKLESQLMQRIAQWTADDMNQWGGDWRKNWVRVRPVALKKALNILEAESESGSWEATKNRAAALKDLTMRLSNE